MTARCKSMLSVLAAVAGTLLPISGAARAEAEFKEALIYLERNVADDDIEVRIVAKTDDTGFAALRVIAPDGRIVIDVMSPASRLGVRRLDLESPEPRDKDLVIADFPEGAYRFNAVLVDGSTLRAEATLRHALPDAPVLSVPSDGQRDLPAKGAEVRWEPVAAAAAIQVVVKERKGLRELRTTLPGNATAFPIPDGFLVPGSKYELAVGAIHESGNRSYQETEFTANER